MLPMGGCPVGWGSGEAGAGLRRGRGGAKEYALLVADRLWRVEVGTVLHGLVLGEAKPYALAAGTVGGMGESVRLWF